MLNTFVGPIDSPAAVVLVVLFAAIAAVIVVAMSLAQWRRNSEAEQELRKAKLAEDSRATLMGIEFDREYKNKQLDQNLITSHRDTTKTKTDAYGNKYQE